MITRSNKMRSDNWTEILFEDLKDHRRAAGYLNECFNDGPETFLLGLRYVVEARGGIGQLAKRTGLGRESLYKLLSGKQGGRLSSIAAILKALGVQTTFAFGDMPKKTKSRRRLVGKEAA